MKVVTDCVGIQNQPLKPNFFQCSKVPVRKLSVVKRILAGAVSNVTDSFVFLRTLSVASDRNPTYIGLSRKGNLLSLITERYRRTSGFRQVGSS